MNTIMLCTGIAEVNRNGPGAFCFCDTRKTMIIWLPCGIYSVNIGDESKQPRWTLSGTDEKPSLNPSIQIPGKWHGHLKDGVLIPC